MVCCWQLIQRLFNLRSFDDKHAEIQGRFSPERSAGGHTKNSAWYRKMFAQVTGLSVSRGDKMTEMFSPEDGRHSMGGTTLQEEKKAADHSITNNGSVFSCALFAPLSFLTCVCNYWGSLLMLFSSTLMSLMGREDNSDATHAIKYRRDNNIA